LDFFKIIGITLSLIHRPVLSDFYSGILIAILNVQNLADGLDNLRRGELTCFNLVHIRIVKVQAGLVSDFLNQPGLWFAQVNQPLADVLSKFTKFCQIIFLLSLRALLLMVILC
jgi:hypothetical protein